MQDSAIVFNAVLYLLSHAAIFRWRTRSVVRAAYEERFVISTKQYFKQFYLNLLDKWEEKDTAKLTVEVAGDVTTEEEKSDCYYTSDYSDENAKGPWMTCLRK